METAIQLVSSSAVFAFTLWLSLRIFAPSNTDNTPGTAVFIGIVFGISGVLFGFNYFIALPLIALLYLLIQFYNLGLIRSFCVVILMGLLSYGIQIFMQQMSASVIA
jgi:hypothetical protein